MRCQVKICRALRVWIRQDVGASVLYPQVIPLVFKTGKVCLRSRHFFEVNEALPDRISRDSRKYLLHSAPVEARCTAASGLDNG